MIPAQVLWREWPLVDDYVKREDGLVACKVYKNQYLRVACGT